MDSSNLKWSVLSCIILLFFLQQQWHGRKFWKEMMMWPCHIRLYPIYDSSNMLYLTKCTKYTALWQGPIVGGKMGLCTSWCRIKMQYLVRGFKPKISGARRLSAINWATTSHQKIFIKVSSIEKTKINGKEVEEWNQKNLNNVQISLVWRFTFKILKWNNFIPTTGYFWVVGICNERNIKRFLKDGSALPAMLPLRLVTVR